MKKHFLFLLGLLFVVSCTEQNDEPTHQAKQPEVQYNSPTRTPQEAQNEVADFLAAMGKKTRSATRHTIANVETLRSRQFATRAAVDSLSIDTLLYFVNFAENQGFAVVAADKRTSPILALIDKGNYSAHDLNREKNTGFLNFLNQVLTIENENAKHPYAIEAKTRSFQYLGWKISEFFPSLLKVNWGQYGPYNIFCPSINDASHAPTGCTVTAVAQICSYYKVPKELSWDSYGTWVHWTYDWDRIISDCKANSGQIIFDEQYNRKYVLTAGEVASLMNYLGIAFKAKYGYETGVPPETPIKWLRKSGWVNATKLEDYKEQRIFSAIKNKFIIYARGNDKKTKTWIFFNKYEGGHAWVIDGYIRGEKDNRTYNLLHCNWGWNGRCNGFFYSKGFDSQHPALEDSVKIGKDIRGNVPYYFKHNLEYSIISPIHP
jgi:hypothetical protein